MLYLSALLILLLLGAAGLLVWQVQRDFFLALEAEYTRQLSRDPGYRKRLKIRRRPWQWHARRWPRQARRWIKVPLRAAAGALGVRRPEGHGRQSAGEVRRDPD